MLYRNFASLCSFIVRSNAIVSHPSYPRQTYYVILITFANDHIKLVHDLVICMSPIPLQFSAFTSLLLYFNYIRVTFTVLLNLLLSRRLALFIRIRLLVLELVCYKI